mmetsp:Transcript_54802/g.108761  ORF Transcript_54802/g.108761 Transcript_54802/m.108761 type:complete len:346 (-) Transcript_54802:202-1239(-)
MAALTLADVTPVLSFPEGASFDSNTAGIAIVDIIKAKGFKKLSSTGDKIDPYISLQIYGMDWLKTKTMPNDTAPEFMERFVIPVPAEKFGADWGTLCLKIMDSDDMSSDDIKASAATKLPPVNEATSFRVLFTEDLYNSDATPKLDVGIYLMPIDDVLRLPNLASALQGQLSAMVAEDEVEDAEMASLKEQLEGMAADDEEDEAEKAALVEQLAAVEATMAEAVAAAAAAQEAKEAEFAEQRAALEAAAAETQAAVDAAAAAAEEAGDATAESMQAQVESLTGSVGSLQEQLRGAIEQLQASQARVCHLEEKVDRMKADDPVNQAKHQMANMKHMLGGKHKKRNK